MTACFAELFDAVAVGEFEALPYKLLRFLFDMASAPFQPIVKVGYLPSQILRFPGRGRCLVLFLLGQFGRADITAKIGCDVAYNMFGHKHNVFIGTQIYAKQLRLRVTCRLRQIWSETRSLRSPVYSVASLFSQSVSSRYFSYHFLSFFFHFYGKTRLIRHSCTALFPGYRFL